MWWLNVRIHKYRWSLVYDDVSMVYFSLSRWTRSTRCIRNWSSVLCVSVMLVLHRFVVFFCFCLFLFFFSSRRRHTRCSRDWSSDVCSSDLILFIASGVISRPVSPVPPVVITTSMSDWLIQSLRILIMSSLLSLQIFLSTNLCLARSEERRVGKECRFRWSPDH